MSTGELIVTWVSVGLLVTVFVSAAFGFAAYRGWITGAATKRVIGFIFFAALSHLVLLRAAPDIGSALLGIFLITVACAAIAYLTWEKTFLESMVYYNGVILLVAGFYGTLLASAYKSDYGQQARDGITEVRKALAQPIDDYLQKNP